MGLYRAGFDVTGVDVIKRSSYPFRFAHADVRDLRNFSKFDFIWASPPCQRYSMTSHFSSNNSWPDLIPLVRNMLIESGKPFVIENVSQAPIRQDLILCGSMFDLRVLRHRIFEANFRLEQPEHRKHMRSGIISSGYYRSERGYISVAGHNFNFEDGKEALDIHWMTSREELAEAIPPAYSYYIGLQALGQI